MYWYMRAYFRVRTCVNRDGDLEWTAVDAYARRWGISNERFPWFEDAMYLMHSVVRSVVAKRKAAPPSPRPGASGKVVEGELADEDDYPTAGGIGKRRQSLGPRR